MKYLDFNGRSREREGGSIHGAHHGDPNGGDAPQWPADEVLSLDIGPGGIAPVDATADHQCGFWDDYDRP